MDAIILCGGYGTRLKSISKGTPKPLVEINGVIFLKYIIKDLFKKNIKKIYLATSYKSHLFQKIFLKYKNIHIVKEKKKIGTGGAIINCLKKKKISKEVIVLNGDSYNVYSYKKFLNFHKKKKSNFSILIKTKENSLDTGNIITDKNSQIIKFAEKKKIKKKHFFNAGVYLIKRNFFLKNFNKIRYYSLEKDLIPNLIQNSKIFAYKSKGEFIDIGTPKNFFLSKKIVKWKN